MIQAFFLGLIEGWKDSAFGMTYDNDAESLRSRAYDHGRTLGLSLAGLV